MARFMGVYYASSSTIWRSGKLVPVAAAGGAQLVSRWSCGTVLSLGVSARAVFPQCATLPATYRQGGAAPVRDELNANYGVPYRLSWKSASHHKGSINPTSIGEHIQIFSVYSSFATEC